MPKLQDIVSELLAIYPRPVPGLTAVTPVSTATNLTIIYLQQNTADALRNWDSYGRWKRENNEHCNGQEAPIIPLPLPHDFSDIYLKRDALFEQGLIKPTDKILLEVHLSQTAECPQPDVTVDLGWIVRNPGPELRNLGREYYSRLVDLLRQKGFRFLKMEAARVKYWQEQGQVPMAVIDPSKRLLIMNPCEAGTQYSHVHFLRDEDKEYFMRS